MGPQNKVLLHVLLIGVVICACSAKNEGNTSMEVKDEDTIGRMIEEGKLMIALFSVSN